MSSQTVDPITRPDLLLNLSSALPHPVPFFVGDQRKKAVSFLVSAISEQRLLSVMQLVNKDPSLAFEVLPMPIQAGTLQTAPVEFPLACLKAGLSAGYVFAISKGFDVDQLLQHETTNLLQTAISLGSTGRGNPDPDLSLLLSLGANPAAMPSKDALYTAVSNAFPAKSSVFNPGAVAMLLDAKADFGYSSDIQCPFSIMVMSGAWESDAGAAAITKLMAKLVNAKLDPNRQTGVPPMSPLMRALGQKSTPAVIALLRIGASTEPEHLKGKEFFKLLEANGLRDLAPQVQAAMMEAQISRSTATSKAAAAASAEPAEGAATQALRSRRARVGAV
ncbi:hypothetical protein [Paucibacter soli]|uniref:hypothetical protein n=1 Tax=Paucibacter soli TaxID=3133433 RepID=UPI0030A23306